MKAAAFWIASASYHDEALLSAQSLRNRMAMPCVLVTPDPFRLAEPWSEVILAPAVTSHFNEQSPWYLRSAHWFELAAMSLAASGYEAALYLDTDVHVTDDLSPVLAMLDRYTVVGTVATGKITTPSAIGTPEAFPEMALGMNAIRLDVRALHLLARWTQLYRENLSVYGNNDQGPFRDALWDTDVRACFLSDEWHWQFRFGGRIRGIVRAFHGRTINLPNIIARVNEPSQAHKLRVYGKGELR